MFLLSEFDLHPSQTAIFAGLRGLIVRFISGKGIGNTMSEGEGKEGNVERLSLIDNDSRTISLVWRVSMVNISMT
jgi:hypothetical protein